MTLAAETQGLLCQSQRFQEGPVQVEISLYQFLYQCDMNQTSIQLIISHVQLIILHRQKTGVNENLQKKWNLNLCLLSFQFKVFQVYNTMTQSDKPQIIRFKK
ncbi:Hypothetical_protein [Hexamita inflata]|uniref:Hypothetical_protein n=1 Tax=Hexamita inflata TaxID=28002 RepID=A0AA86R9U1_9EUKA|nr:Hypothetical protein HINF_LOCUS56319 [Hexamita inflata]